MSKAIKSLIESELSAQFRNIAGAAVVSPAGIDGNTNNALRRTLHGKGLKMLVVKNSLARRAAADKKLKGIEKLFTGPSAVIFGEKAEVSAIARLLVDAKKENAKLELRGVLFDGDVYVGEKGVEEVSKFPTREEAIADILGCILSPGRNVAGAIDQGGMVASLVKAVEAKKESEGGAA